MPEIEDITDAIQGPIIEELTEEEAAEGERVELHGLKAKAELNGRRGRALKWDPVAQRMGVELDDRNSVKVRMVNLRVLDVSEPDPPSTATPVQEPDTKESQISAEPPASGGHESKNTPPQPELASDGLMIAVAGDAFDALRPALASHGGVHQVSTSKLASTSHDAATVDEIVAVMSKPGVAAAAVAQALAALAKIAPGQGRLLLRSLGGAAAATAAMGAHAGSAAVQGAGSELLSALSKGGKAEAVSAVLDGDGVGTALRAMKRHPSDVRVQLGTCTLLRVLCGADESQKADADGPRAASHAVWKRIDAAGGIDAVCKHTVGALQNHPQSAAVQATGCALLNLVSATDGDGKNTACELGGVGAAVEALEWGLAADEREVRQQAIFLIATLASGNDECKATCGKAGAPNALAKAVLTYRAQADMLRLSIGALVQLAQVEAGRRHVIGSKAIAAVVVGMRAHASDAAVLDEGCYFIAALAYGGREGRKAANEAGMGEVLNQAIRRFGGKPSHAKTVEMAKTILARLQQTE